MLGLRRSKCVIQTSRGGAEHPETYETIRPRFTIKCLLLRLGKERGLDSKRRVLYFYTKLQSANQRLKDREVLQDEWLNIVPHVTQHQTSDNNTQWNKAKFISLKSQSLNSHCGCILEPDQTQCSAQLLVSSAFTRHTLLWLKHPPGTTPG